MLAHHRRPGGVVEARHPETGGVPGGLPRGGEVQPRGLEARDAAQALRAAGAQDLRRLRLVGRVVAGGHGARVAARARLRRAQGGPRAHGRRRHRQDAHGVGPLRAGVREEARGALLHGVVARDAPEARPRRREARPGGRAHRQGPPARHRRARVSPARRGRGEAALPGLRRRIREAVGGDHHESGVQQVGVGVRGRPDGRRRDRPDRPPREARPVPRRVLPRPPCPHAGGLAAQKACALPMLRLLNLRCSFCSSPLDETQPAVDTRGRLLGTLFLLSGHAVLRSPGAGRSGPQGIGFPHSSAHVRMNVGGVRIKSIIKVIIKGAPFVVSI